MDSSKAEILPRSSRIISACSASMPAGGPVGRSAALLSAASARRRRSSWMASRNSVIGVLSS
jgi:hypothetical protein